MVDTENKFYVVLSCDTDSDQFLGDLSAKAKDKSIQGWEGFDKGKDIIADAVDTFGKNKGLEIPLTWFVRCDYQIERTYGDAAYLLNEYASWWQYRVDTGDEIQWHAHLYSFKDGLWQQETENSALRSDLSGSLERLHTLGIYPSTVRVGEAYQSNELMAFLEYLGLRADSSALPGRVRQDDEKLLDWASTPNSSYRPSYQDYRRPEAGNSRAIWEVPMNTVPVKVSYDKEPILRYVNLAFQPGSLKKGLQEYVKHNSCLVSMTHPFELIPKFFSDSNYKSHPLLAFEPNAFKQNLQMLVDVVAESGKEIQFVSMNQMLDLLDEMYS